MCPRFVTQVKSNMVKNAITTKSVLGETDPVTRRVTTTAERREHSDVGEAASNKRKNSST